MSIVYARETALGVADYVAVLADTIMRDNRPLDNPSRIAEMLAGANFVVTARENGQILGLARCLTDHSWICYCAELAVKDSTQGRGIGTGILQKCWELRGPRVGFTLLSQPTAATFYEHIGMERCPDAFLRNRTDRA